jgi:hypothetical protein
VPPTYVGTSQTFCSIPSLLISDLGRAQDPIVRRALLQIQDFCNSIGTVQGTTGSSTATLGTHYPGVTTTPATWTQVSYQGQKAYIPVWV